MPLRPRGRIDAAMLEAALRGLQGLQGTVVASPPTERQVYFRCIVTGSYVGPAVPATEAQVHASPTLPDAVMASLVDAGLKQAVPRFKTFLEAEWAGLYPNVALEVMSFRLKGAEDSAERCNLHVLAAVDPHDERDVTQLVRDFCAHLVALVEAGGGVDVCAVDGRLVAFVAAPVPDTVRVEAMGRLDMYTGAE